MYISFALGLIAKAKQRKCLVGYRLYIPKRKRIKCVTHSSVSMYSRAAVSPVVFNVLITSSSESSAATEVLWELGSEVKSFIPLCINHFFNLYSGQHLVQEVLHF